MTPPDGPKRYIGGTPGDEAIGRLLERTEAIAIQHEDFRRVLEGLNGTLATLRETIVRLDATLNFVAEKSDDHAEKLKGYDAMATRVTACETELRFWADIRSQVVKYAIIVLLIALTGGMGGTLLTKAFGVH